VSAEAEIKVKWTCEVQKFKACRRHDARYPGYEPFDPACPDCLITEPPQLADVTVNESIPNKASKE
jgi:hypothetical protein